MCCSTGATRWGLGSAVIRPFLDDNYNGEYDEGEQYLAGLRANIKGAGRRTHGEQRLYYYDRLRPYAEYMVEIDEVSLDNPLLKPTADHFSVTVNPNVVTSVEVPLVLGGELSGSVMRPRGAGHGWRQRHPRNPDESLQRKRDRGHYLRRR